jgi:hypothetical protein
MKRAGWGVVLGMSCALLGAACQPEGDTGPDGELGEDSVKMRISLQGDACGVVSADATVSAPDFMPIGPEPLFVQNGYIEGGIQDVPAGQQRLVDVRAYNTAGLVVYAGSAFVDVYDGPVSYAQLTLKRNPHNCPGTGTGDIYIIGVLEGRPGEIDGGAYDAGPGPGWDAGSGWDAGPGPSYDAGYAPRP